MTDPYAEYYSLLRTCFYNPPDEKLLKTLYARSQNPPAFPTHPDITDGWRKIAIFFSEHSIEEARTALAQAHYLLFDNPLGSKVEPYASHYLEGIRQGTPLVNMREFLMQWRLVPERELFRDFEDHAIFMLDCLVKIADLADREGDHWEEAMEELLVEHVLPWMPVFLSDLEKADEDPECGGFYAGLAIIGRGLLKLEAQVLQQ
ncbi:MAG: molecular chaperone [Desulfobacterales bacterium]